MIEKLSFLDTNVNCVDYKGFVHNVAEGGIINKINEIIALLNAIVVDVDGTKCIDGSKKAEPADPYEKQRKWIGCLCRFWNFKDGAVDIGILKAIDNLKPTIPYINDIDCSYAFCEPVKPDDDIIYKGE